MKLFKTNNIDDIVMPNTHRRRRRDETVLSRRRRRCVLGISRVSCNSGATNKQTQRIAIIGVGARSTLGVGARLFDRKLCMKINKMSEFYVIYS